MDYPQIVTTISEGLPPISTTVEAPWVAVTSLNGMTGDVIVDPIIKSFEAYHYYVKDSVITNNGTLCFAKQTFTSGGSFNANDWDIPDFAQEQADWNESDSSAKSYIKNKPSIPNPTDYYWANIKVSNQSKTNTVPTFGQIMVTSSTFPHIGGNGTYLTFSRGASYGAGEGSVVLDDNAFRPSNTENGNINLGRNNDCRWKNLYLSGDIYHSTYKLTLPNQAGTVALTSDLPTVNDGVLTIQKNSTTIDTFSANQSGNKTINIGVPVDTGDLTNNAGFLTADDIYPVNSVRILADTADHSTDFGQTWVRYGAGRVLVGYDSTQTEFNSIGKTGGEKTHKLTVSEMPSHKHSLPYRVGGGGGSTWYTDPGTAEGYSDSKSEAKGGDQAHNNLQPYIVVSFWRRTA